MRKYIELKVPPVILVILVISLTNITAKNYFVFINYEQVRIYFSYLLSIVGIVIAIFGLFKFREKKTTVNPHKPQNSSSLVNDGIFLYTRNPMYLGLLALEIAYIIYTGSFISIVYCFGYILYMNEFQIKPEEKHMTELFGHEYLNYKKLVRRWI